MRVLVTGAAGFIGSHLAEALVAAGHDVVGLDAFTAWYPRAVKERNLAAVCAGPRFALHELDLAEDPLEDALSGIDAVVHLAAQPGLSNDPAVAARYDRDNVVATRRLVAAATAAGVARFVHASTSSVYGTEAVGGEDLPVAPVSRYGETKLAAEGLVRAAASARFEPVVLRYFSLYGPRQRPDMAYHRFVEALLDDRPIELHGDGEQTRSNTYVTDAVGATIAALERGRPGATYNIGGGRTISLNAALGTLAELAGVTPRIVRVAPRPGDQRHTGADVTRARTELGWAPTVEPADGLARQVAWHRGLRAA